MGKGNRSCAQGMSGELYTGKSAQAIELTTGSLSVRQHSSMVSLVRDLDLGIFFVLGYTGSVVEVSGGGVGVTLLFDHKMHLRCTVKLILCFPTCQKSNR